jgi:epoxyqueuosine reductase
MDLKDRIKAKASELGFNRIGVTDAGPLPEIMQQHYQRWLGMGYHAGMKYLETGARKRLDPRTSLDYAKTVLSVALNYNPGEIAFSPDRSRARISRYALGIDYHLVISEKLDQLLDFIKRESDGSIRGRVFCDTGPLMEKVIAERAGIGWIGKHGILVTREYGSWIFLGEIVLDIELEPDEPAENLCSSCSFCLESCPTKAIVEPGVVDAFRCISYQTVENRNAIPEEIRGAFGNRVFGCDCCQEACPYNSDVPATDERMFLPKPELVCAPLEMLFAVAAARFDESFKDSAIIRARKEGFLRNIVLAMGNSGHTKFIPLLEKAKSGDDVLLREHAEWAIEEIAKTE